MDRRAFVTGGLAALAVGVLAGCNTTTGGGGSTSVDPSAESIKAATEKVLTDKGATTTAWVKAGAAGVSVLVNDDLHTPAGGTTSFAGAKSFAATEVSTFPFDKLSAAAGTTGDWGGQAVMLAGDKHIFSGKTSTTLGGVEAKASDNLISKDGLSAVWTEMLAVTGGKLSGFKGDAKAISYGLAGEQAFHVKRLAAVGETGLVSIEAGELTADDATVPADLDAATLLGRVESELAREKQAWDAMGAVRIELVSNTSVGITDGAALLLGADEVDASGVIVFLDAQNWTKHQQSVGAGQAGLVGKKAPTTLPGGWADDPNYTVAPADRTMRDANDTFMFSYRNGAAVVSVSFTSTKRNQRDSDWKRALEQLQGATEVDGWTVGDVGGLTHALRKYEQQSFLTVNSRGGAQKATRDQVLAVAKAFHTAVAG
ncbi:hypothetical protein ACQB6R_00700 [Propionibacteriaceae bacterium G1746]|uniref:hypothetical protein n=1 Tax=Aestuariimicrobium sp. G57 TaxID=3418485 RepID=UPI003C248566